MIKEEETSREHNRTGYYFLVVLYLNGAAGRLISMALLLSAPQCFFLGMIAFGLLGFIQGWRRAVILTVFTLAGVLFLSLKGGSGIATLIFVRGPVIWQEIVSPSSPISTPPAPDNNQVFLVTFLSFLAIVAAGYLIGQRAFDPKTSAGTPFGRIMGILPGLVTGYFFINYMAGLFNSSVVSLGVTTPGQNVLSDSIPVLFLVAVVVVVLGLITTRVKKGGAKK